MNVQLKQYSDRTPEVVFEWKDRETEACGWVVINSLRGGAAGGGTRMHPKVDRHEVVSLAKTMEIKFTVSGPQIGGAKSGIRFDPNDPRKAGVLRRWYAAIAPLLKHYYGTGGDMNVDNNLEVIPNIEQCGIWHPQEGVFNGHYQPNDAQKVRRIGNLRAGVSQIVEDKHLSPSVARKYSVADLITGYGVAQSVEHFYDLYHSGQSVHGKRVIVQGWGNVGAAAAYYLAQSGAKIVGIIDQAGGLLAPEGLSQERITALFNEKDGNALRADDMVSFDEANAAVWSIGAEVFLPCAASRLVGRDHLAAMRSGGLEVVAAGANVPFADPEIFYGAIAEEADQAVAVIPDFIANCGMARVFGYLMADENVNMSDAAIFADTSNTIRRALEKSHALRSDPTLLTSTAMGIALDVINPA
jgi:glutamate dehydrogenase/leucine dehydrogenase